MKILYVTELWNGFEDLISRGEFEASGMPSFIYPLKTMINDKGYLIDFAIIVRCPREFNINVSWLKNSRYFWVNRRSFIKVITLIKVIRKGKYDFVYGHGGGGGWGNLAALIARKPFGMRYYGTFLGQHLNDSYFRFFRRNLLKSIVYNLPKKFMIITNDGTKGDLVYKKLCLNKKAYAFKFWLNGVNKSSGYDKERQVNIASSEFILDANTKILLYPARYDPWKRQELAIEVLHELKRRYNKDFTLIFCGHKYDVNYYEKLLKVTSSLGLVESVLFFDPFQTEVLSLLMERSFAVLSLYKFSNLGNVMIEAAQRGSFVITVKDGSSDFLVENDVTGVSIPYDSSIAATIADRLHYYASNDELTIQIRKNLQKRADEIFLTWEERALQEINLIEESISS